ncbi:hypothetical protein MVEG_04871 [Podila verticillata NRRL 6337]|nr:hypothetical protein MVEG_04871 [Podila verticillata NRRL 6337]
MLGLVSSSSTMVATDALKTVLPIGIGLASAAFLTMKMITPNTDQSIQMASLRAGDSTHDDEYNDDQDEFLARCEEEYGPVFKILLMNKTLTVVSGRLIREVFMNENFSAGDSIDEFTGMRAFFHSMIKSNKELDNRVIHEVVRDNISPNLPTFTPRIVEQLEIHLEKCLGKCDEKLVVNPLTSVLQEMIAGAMACVFVGPEVAKSRQVIDTFITCTTDFGKVLGNGNRRKSVWHTFATRAKYRTSLLNPMDKHIRVLVEATTPVILERRRIEAEANEAGREYIRPDDILQRLLDNFDKYNFVDLEDVCGHLLILILASVHTTSDTSTNLLYYLASFPQYQDKLYEEQKEVLDAQQKEREELRKKCLEAGEAISEELDPAHDRDLTAAAVKKMVHMDSFVREIFRYRTERLTLTHRARKDVTLSNGMVLYKGENAIINMKSAHQSPEQGEDVAEFRPWRFVGKPKAATKAGNDFLPFGMGKHACPGRFLAIQELKTVGVLMISKYSKIQIQDPSKTKKVLRSRIGEPIVTGLIFTSRK